MRQARDDSCFDGPVRLPRSLVTGYLKTITPECENTKKNHHDAMDPEENLERKHLVYHAPETWKFQAFIIRMRHSKTKKRWFVGGGRDKKAYGEALSAVSKLLLEVCLRHLVGSPIS